MHRAFIVAVALLGIGLYALFGRVGEDPATDDGTAALGASSTAAHRENEATPGSAEAGTELVASRPLLEQPRHAVAGEATPAGARPAEEPAGNGLSDQAIDEQRVAAVEPGRSSERAEAGQPGQGAAERRGDTSPAATSRGGALANPNCPVSLNRMFLARGIEDREPVGIDRVFSSDDQRVYVFIDVNNARGPEQDMVIHWDHLGSDHTYEQRIAAGPYPRWRTWVYHTMRRPLAGNWYVRVTNERGCTLGELYFEATPYRGS